MSEHVPASEFVADKPVAYAPAFPLGQCSPHYGMSLRAYFAAKAMQGILANPEPRFATNAEIANYSVEYADALIQRLNHA